MNKWLATLMAVWTDVVPGFEFDRRTPLRPNEEE